MLRRSSSLPFSLLALSLIVLVSGCFYIAEFRTYFGGIAEDTVRDVVIAPDGTIVVVGGTASADLPGRLNSLSTGGYSNVMDGFVAKLSSDGTQVLWSRYLGGPNYDRSYAVEVDQSGNIYVAGRAGAGFPTTAGSVQPVFGGDHNNTTSSLYGQQDGFVAKISASGNVIWATYVGGNDASIIRDIAVDANENIYIVMPDIRAASPFVTSGTYQPQHFGSPDAAGIYPDQDGFIGKLQSDGSRFIWGTYFGSSGDDVLAPTVRLEPRCLTDRSQVCNIYVAGSTTSPGLPVSANAPGQVFNNGVTNGSTDVFITKFSPDGSQLLYSTYIGGSQNDGTETHNLAVEDDGTIYVAATTRSSDLSGTAGTVNPSYLGSATSAGTGQATNYPGDGFISVIRPDGSLLASTYVGGNFGDGIQGIFVDVLHNIYVSGGTYSTNLQVTPDAPQKTNGGQADLFVARLSPDLRTLQFSTYAGGRDVDYGRSISGDFLRYGVHVVAGGQSLIGTGTPFPTTPGAADAVKGNAGVNEGIVVKFVAQN